MAEEYHSAHGSQFSPRRVILFLLAFAAMFGWIWWIRTTYPLKGGDAKAVPGDLDWSQFNWLAVTVVVIVLGFVAAFILIERRVEKRLPEEEKDWHGPDPHIDRMIPVESYTPSPIMRAALRRTLAHHHEGEETEAATEGEPAPAPPTPLPTAPGSRARGLGRLLPKQYTLESVPMHAVLVTMTVTLMGVGYAVTTEAPLYIIALYAIVPSLPLFFFEASWKYEHYGFYAVMTVFVMLQLGHLAEHTVQVVQVWLNEGDASQAHGVFGALDRELVHFVWDSLVFLGLGVLFIKLGPHNKWLVIALVAASFHEIEHLFLYYLDRWEPAFYNAGGTTGIMAEGGLIGSPFERPYLHYIYNFVVVVPLCIAFWDETRRAYNLYLARALPSLSHQERVSASTELERVRLPAGQEVVRQGEEADNFFIIVKGEVEVIREDEKGGRIVDRMGEGHFFGEMGILTGQPRTATIRAVTDVELMRLGAEEFMALVARSKGAAADVESELHERLVNLREKGIELDHLHGAMVGAGDERPPGPAG